MKANRCGAVIAIAFMPFAADAWGPAGHESVGAIAAELLKGSAAEAQVKSILDTTTLQQAAVWAGARRG